MGTIDERIVKMTFDNSSFEKGVSQTIKSLEKLNEVLKATGNTDAVNNISKSMKDIKSQLNTLDFDALNKVEVKESIWKKIGNVLSAAGKGLGNFISKLDLGGSVEKLGSSFSNAVGGAKGLDKSVESVNSKFTALGIIGATALANITNKMVNLGTSMLKSLTVEPVMTGFSEYETKMGSIQTILANTAHQGTTLTQVTKVLDELNKYSDDTIYNFEEMTRNIGTFTAAGIDLDTSAASIKGIANLAALSGSSSQQASTAMYQLSQALAAGKVSLADWNSVVNAGMGGKVFQDALIRTSEKLGTGAEKMIDKYGSFRESLTKGEWLTSEVLTETLKQLSGAYTEAELISQGYTEKQAKEIMEMAKTGQDAATQVKTVTQLVDTMKESIQSGWAESWEHIIGDKDQAIELLTNVKNAFEGIIGPSTEARNNMLEFWNQNGGRDAVIKGLTNVFQSLGKIMGSIGDAWKDVFPSMTGKKLVELSQGFKDFTEKLKVSDSTVKKIKDTFKGVFSVFKTIGSAVSSVIKAFSPLTAVFPAIGNAVLSVTSAIGRFVSGMSSAIQKSQVMDKIANVVRGAFEKVGDIINGASDMFSQFFDYIGSLDFSKAFNFLGKGFSAIGDLLGPIFTSLGKAIGTIDFGAIMNTLKTATFLEVLKTLKDTFEEVGGIAESAKGMFSSFKGIGQNVKDTLNAAREALEAWQNNLQADTLMKIAGAVAMLAASLILIASVPSDKLVGALGGMAAIFTELSLAYVAMMKYGGVTSIFSKGIGSGLLTMATSVLILAAALKVLSTLNAGEMLSGIVGVLVALTTLGVAAKLFDKRVKNLRQTASALIVFGVAMMTMAVALKMLGSIDAETLGGGLFALAGVLTELALFLAAAKFGSLGISDSVGILVLSASLVVLSQAVKEFGTLKTETIIRGLAGIAGMMAEIAIFSKFAGSGTQMILLAAGLAAMSIAILGLSLAMKSMGNISWEELGRGLTSLAGSLVILGVAGKLISGLKLVGLAVGLAAMGAAMLVLGAALKSLGSQSWEQVGISLVSLAGALTVLGIAMYAMSGCLAGATALVVMATGLAILTPQLIALGQMDLASVGIALLAMAGAFTVLGLAGYLLAPIVPAILGLAAAIALLGVGCLAAGAGVAVFAAGFAAFAAAIAGSGLLIVEFLRQVINLLPQLGAKAGEAMVSFATAVGTGAPAIIGAWRNIMTELLGSITELAPKIAETAIAIVSAFAQTLATAIPELVSCGMQMILGILEGIASNIGQVTTAAIEIIVNFVNAVAGQLGAIIDAGVNLALSFIEGVANGISSNSARLEAAISSVIQAMAQAGLAVIRGAISGFTTGGKQILEGFCNGVKSMMTSAGNAVKSCVDAAKKAASNLGSSLISAGKSLVEGFISGITSMAKSVASKAAEVVTGAINAAKNALKINSPSKVFISIGKSVDEGFIDGLNAWSNKVNNTATELTEGIIENAQKPLSNLSKIIDGDINVNPTITPVLDLSNVERNSRRLGDLLPGSGSLSLTTDRATLMSSSIGQIQNGTDNSNIVSALKDLKASMADNRPSYTVNGITYDDGSNIVNAVESLVRAAKIERRI